MENQVRILVIRFSSIGDIVLTTPVIRCMKEQMHGEILIHYLTKSVYASILQANPYVDAIHTIRKSTGEVMDELRQLNFDYIIDLHKNIRSGQVKSKLKKLTFTFKKFNIEKWLLVNLGINRMPDQHIVDRYMEAVRALGVRNDGKGLDYFIPQDEEVNRTELPSRFHEGYIGFAIGGQYDGKKLPLAKLITICRQIDYPIVLLGGREDQENAAKIVSIIGERGYNACGLYSLHQSASLVKQADLIITHDTGLMHIAAALGRTIISIWGATVPAFGMYPYQPGKDSIMVQADHLKFRPTSKLGNRNSRRERRTVNEISDAEIIRLAEERLGLRKVSGSE